jgi:hypothetical protein
MVCTYVYFGVSWNSLDGIAIRYGMNSPGIQSRWRREFPHLSRPAVGSTQPSIQCIPGPFHGSKAVGAWP